MVGLAAIVSTPDLPDMVTGFPPASICKPFRSGCQCLVNRFVNDLGENREDTVYKIVEK